MSPATSRAFVRSTVKLLFPQRLHDRLPGLLGDVVEGAVEAELGAPTVGDVDAEGVAGHHDLADALGLLADALRLESID